MNWFPLLWLATALALLLVIERWSHRHLQGVTLLLTGDPEMAVVLYSLPLLPGIIVHELSHALTAALLGVPVGRISVRPKRAGQRVQLGFVPIEKTDVVRASIIGLAPLVIGSVVVVLIGYAVFGLGTVGTALAAEDWPSMATGLLEMLEAPDTWLWAYVIFAVSNTMLPSRSDRQTWRPVILFLLLIAAVFWAAGLGRAVVDSLASTLLLALQWLALMCAFTVLADLPFVLLIAALEKLTERAKGVRVEY